MIHFMVVWDLVDWVSMTTSTQLTNMVPGPIVTMAAVLVEGV
jgi:hypothetical protein